MKSATKLGSLSTGILLSLLVTSHPLAVKADENSAVTPPNQTEAVTNPTVNSSLAASDSTIEGNTESSQAEMQTKAANSLLRWPALLSALVQFHHFNSISIKIKVKK